MIHCIFILLDIMDHCIFIIIYIMLHCILILQDIIVCNKPDEDSGFTYNAIAPASFTLSFTRTGLSKGR